MCNHRVLFLAAALVISCPALRADSCSLHNGDPTNAGATVFPLYNSKPPVDGIILGEELLSAPLIPLALKPEAASQLQNGRRNRAPFVKLDNGVITISVTEPSTWSMLVIGICWLAALFVRRDDGAVVKDIYRKLLPRHSSTS
jgi:hypothetical protein